MVRSSAFGRTSEQPECSSSVSSRLTREQVVDRIVSMNPSATPDFLADFEDTALSRYQDRLTAARSPRARTERWIRAGDTPAIMSRRAGRH